MSPDSFELQQARERIKELQDALRYQQEIMRLRKITSDLDYKITDFDRALLTVAGVTVNGDTWRD